MAGTVKYAKSGSGHFVTTRRVLAYTTGTNVPGSRYRIQQFIPLLRQHNIEMTEVHTRTTAYPPARNMKRVPWALGRSCELLYQIATQPKADAVIIQREMLSTLHTFERLTGHPRVFDVDDAIHLHRHGKSARGIAQGCDRIIAGNAFLAEVYQAWNKAVTIIPTCVDTMLYRPIAPVDRPVTIGWIGTSSNAKYLTGIQLAFHQVLEKHKDARVLVVSDKAPTLPDVPADRVTFRTWRADREIADLQDMDIGVMPLEDTLWARGKCSFKMLQYMACGVPVVVSPVGMNSEVLAKAVLGFAARNISEWTDALDALVANASLRRRLGQEGRKVCVQSFSTQAWAPVLRDVLTFG
jgi:glycosyltransferase involved in cell wall biosynthesis